MPQPLEVANATIDLLTLEVMMANKSEEYLTWYAFDGTATVFHAKCLIDHHNVRNAAEHGVLSYASEAEKLKGCWGCNKPYMR